MQHIRKAERVVKGILMRKLCQAAVIVALLAPINAGAQDFATGNTAYLAGDHETAFNEWRPLAEQGNARAQFKLGWMYNFGRGVPRDDAEAVKWYRLAAEQGDPEAQFTLGGMYYIGRDVPQDYTEAVKWYRRVAEQSDATAQFKLGWMYDEGEGVPQDHAEAVKWYRLAAEQGAAPAQTNLGRMYAEGKGVPQDFVSAHMWWNIAAANENGYAREQRDYVAEKMTQADISEAQRSAAPAFAWKAGIGIATGVEFVAMNGGGAGGG